MAVAPVSRVIAGGTANTVTTVISDTTGANLLVCVASWYSITATAANLTDSKSNSGWVLIATYTGGAGYKVGILYCVPTSVGSSHTATFAGTGSYPSLDFRAYSGAHATPLDQESGAASTSPGSLTPSEDNCLIVCGRVSVSGTIPTIGSGFTNLDYTTYLASNHMGGGGADLIQTTAAASNPAWSVADACAQAIFKPAAASGLVLPVAAHHYNMSRGVA